MTGRYGARFALFVISASSPFRRNKYVSFFFFFSFLVFRILLQRSFIFWLAWLAVVRREMAVCLEHLLEVYLLGYQ